MAWEPCKPQVGITIKHI